MSKKGGHKNIIKQSILSHPVRSCIIGCLLLLGFTYFWFAFGLPVVGFVAPTGEDIYKSDWLSFWGGFLSFAGATVLGAVAVWQNKQANQTNQQAIEENRRIYQIGFENDLRKAKYSAIIHAIEESNTKLIEINKNFLHLLHEAESTRDQKTLISVYDKTIESLNFLVSFEFDQMLPLSFDSQYPEIKEYRTKIKEQIQGTIVGLEEQKKQVIEMIREGQSITGIQVTIGNNQEALIKILGVFYNKLYAINSYKSVNE